MNGATYLVKRALYDTPGSRDEFREMMRDIGLEEVREEQRRAQALQRAIARNLPGFRRNVAREIERGRMRAARDRIRRMRVRASQSPGAAAAWHGIPAGLVGGIGGGILGRGIHPKGGIPGLILGALAAGIPMGLWGHGQPDRSLRGLRDIAAGRGRLWTEHEFVPPDYEPGMIARRWTPQQRAMAGKAVQRVLAEG
jgi:hypothetical protein